ncbi:MAG: beta-galactosidase, partial [Phycisphaerae bacterium]|nr:beta-galactosidase [Phycisphaerae bacterium]
SLLELKSKVRAMPKSVLGCGIEPQLISNSGYFNKFSDLFGLAFVPVNWATIEKKEGVYDWSELDQCMNLLTGRKILLGCGPILCFSPEYLPAWLVKGKPDFEKIREAAYNFVAEIVGRYLNVRLWNVISGMNSVNVFGFNFEQILEMTRAATMAAKAANEKAFKIVDVTQPWGEYYAVNQATIPPLVYLDMVVQSGMNFEAFGLQMKFGKNENGMQVRDLMHISALLDKLIVIAKPVYITGIEVSSEYAKTEESCESGDWDKGKQSRWLEQFCRIALSKPFVEALVYANLADSDACSVEHSGLLEKDFSPKATYDSLKKFQKVLCRR